MFICLKWFDVVYSSVVARNDTTIVHYQLLIVNYSLSIVHYLFIKIPSKVPPIQRPVPQPYLLPL